MRVYDCFIYFNELNLLKIRLWLLRDIADKFVIVECTKDHHGNDKKSMLDLNDEFLRVYKDKIIHIIVEDLPNVFLGGGERRRLDNRKLPANVNIKRNFKLQTR